MNLTIKQSTTLTENASSSNIVETLYQLTKPDPLTGLPSADAILKGRIQVPAAYEDAVSFLNTQFSADNSDNGSDFQVTVLNNNYYIRFADEEIVRVLVSKGIMDEDEGLTVAQAAQVKWSDAWFRNNSLIRSFDEIRYFTGLLQQGAQGYPRTEQTFQGATALESVDITNIVAISYYEFAECPNLIRFHGKDGPVGVLNLESLQRYPSDSGMTHATAHSAFYKCPGIQHITSLGSIPYIKHNMFSTCLNLEDVNLPLTCTGINNNAFNGDSKLTTINLSHVTYIGEGVFNGCSSLEYCGGPNSTQGELNLSNLTGTLGNNAFKGCIKLTSIASLGSITSIGNSAFENCTSLATINFPNTITSVGINAFNNTAWYSNQPDGEIVIGSCLYRYKGAVIGTYTIPSNITSVTDSCFYGQSSLTGITSWPSSQKTIPNNCFQNSGLTSFDLTGIVTIAINAFRSSKLISIVIPNTVTYLGDDCFSGCQNLSSITIGTGVTRLGRNIFSYCSSVETLVIPSNVKSLERDTLSSCSSLQWVRLESETIVSLNNASCFNNTNNCIIYVPSDLVDGYKADSKWSSLASRIQAIPTT